MRHVHYSILVFICSGLISSCGGGGGGGGTGESNVTIDGVTSSEVPAVSLVAAAGPDQSGSVDVEVTLDGSASTATGEVGGNPLLYLWDFSSTPSGSNTQLVNSETARPTFIPDVAGTYAVRLVVGSGELRSTPATVFVQAYEPVANAGQNQRVSTGDTVTLNGSDSVYAGEEPISYSWTIDPPDGSKAIFFDPTVPTPSFIADISGSYEITLTFSNGIKEGTDSIIVNAVTIPVAKAGPDLTISRGSTVVLNGSNSSSSDGATLSYQWRMESKPLTSFATLSTPNDATTTFIADDVGEYSVSLIVDNGEVSSDPDTIVVTAAPPTANAGTDQVVSAGSIVGLDGSQSHEAEALALTFNWEIRDKPSESTAVLSNDSAIKPAFTADKEGRYEIALVVSNGREDSVEDIVAIDATKPVANAGENLKISTGASVTLDGSASNDPVGLPLSFSWSFQTKPTNSLAIFDEPESATPTFIADLDGSYLLSLVVNNGFVDSEEDVVTVIATTAPVANAGVDQSVSTAETVSLDGSASRDAKGADLFYAWTLKSIPDGSSSTLLNPLTSNPSFLADKEGRYEVGLVVNNGVEDSAEDVIEVDASNPVANAGGDQNVTPGLSVTLDGRASLDPNDYTLSYLWSVADFPIGSAVTISDPSSETPIFSADAIGSYRVELLVNNGFVDSEIDVIEINVRESVGNDSGVFSTDFENDTENTFWSTDNGVWEIGPPTSGPGIAYIGKNVAATILHQNYPDHTSSRLTTPSIQLPEIAPGEELQLGFWHWFDFYPGRANVLAAGCDLYSPQDSGIIQISEQTIPGVWSSWANIGTSIGRSGSWVYKLMDISSYATKTIRIGIYLSNPAHIRSCTNGTRAGWYIDELLVEKRM